MEWSLARKTIKISFFSIQNIHHPDFAMDAATGFFQMQPRSFHNRSLDVFQVMRPSHNQM